MFTKTAKVKICPHPELNCVIQFEGDNCPMCDIIQEVEDLETELIALEFTKGIRVKEN